MTANAIARIWRESADLVRSRVEQIEDAAAELLDGGLGAEYRTVAIHAAHMLAGSAGSFGFAQASTLAREAELLLEANVAPGPSAVLRLSAIAVQLREQLVDKPVPVLVTTEHPRTIVAVIFDVMLLELLGAALGPRGIIVHGVKLSVLARDAIHRVRPNVIVIDIDTPNLDGVALCRDVRSDLAMADTPIIVLGLDTDATRVEALLAAGATAHVAKPVDLEQLVERLTTTLSQTRRTSGARPKPESRTPQNTENGERTTDVAILDDDAILSALLCQTLESRGHSCRVIDNGVDAMTELCGRRSRMRAAVVLMEVSLPGLDGLSLLRAFGKAGVTQRARIVMLTARTLESEMLQALELGAHDYIAKPFSIPVLMHRLRGALTDVSEGQ
jgi:DNA-binding response OmpR family regulator/HPt (histidine-containing phosphotransfer) domain-containing protein